MTKMNIPTLTRISDNIPIVPPDTSPDEPRIRIKGGCLIFMLTRVPADDLEYYTFDNELGDAFVEVASSDGEIVSIAIDGISSLQRSSDWREAVMPGAPSDTRPDTPDSADDAPGGDVMGDDGEVSDTTADTTSDT